MYDKYAKYSYNEKPQIFLREFEVWWFSLVDPCLWRLFSVVCLHYEIVIYKAFSLTDQIIE